MTRSPALAVLVCLAAALVLTGSGALGSRDLYTGDVGHFEQPRDELVTARRRAGQGLPRWLPGVFGGAPALGGQELALLYPPNDALLIVAPERARVWGLALHLVLAALGARALARRLGAGPGASLAAGLVYGFGGAAVSMNTVLVYARSAGWLPWAVLGLVAASGVGDGRIESSPAQRNRGLALAVLGLLGTYLGGDPLGCGFAGLVALIAVVTLPGLDVTRLKRVGRALVVAGALTALLGAVQLVPAALATRESVRAQGMTYEGATVFSLHPAELFGLVVPFAFGAAADPETAWFEAFAGERAWAEVLYVGPIALTLAAVALATLAGRRSRASPLARAGAAIFLGFLLLALGRWTPLYAAFFHLPGASLFRYPAKLFLHASLGLALLVAAGGEALVADGLEKNDSAGKLRIRAAAVLGALTVAAFVATNVLRAAPVADYGATLIDHLGSEEAAGKEALAALAWRLMHVFFVGAGGVALLLGSGARTLERELFGWKLRAPRAPRMVLGLAILIGVDLVLACRPALILGPRAEVERPPAVAALLEKQGQADGVPARVYPTFKARQETPGDLAEARARVAAGGEPFLRDEGLLPNRGMAQGVLSQHGFLSNAPRRASFVSELADRLQRQGFPAPAAIALRGARYVLIRQDEAADFPRTKLVALVPGGRELRQLEVAPPWAGVYGPAVFVPGGPEAATRAVLEREQGRSSGVGAAPLVLESLEPGRDAGSSGSSAITAISGWVAGSKVRLDGYEPERLQLQVDSPEPGWLVVREAYASGWSATVDGAPVEILPADVAFRAVRVPAGSSRVVFTYSAPGLVLGATLSALTALACLVFVFLSQRRSKKAGDVSRS